MSKIDIGSAAQRVIAGLQPDFEMMCLEAAREYAPLVESEIELMVLATFKVVSRITNLKIEVGEECKDETTHILITPQYQWGVYRIDFCFRAQRQPERLVFVECDGHEFHERTKEQAERDRSKDRAIQTAGIPILRFTGREIWRNPPEVMVEIFEFLGWK